MCLILFPSSEYRRWWVIWGRAGLLPQPLWTPPHPVQRYYPSHTLRLIIVICTINVLLLPTQRLIRCCGKHHGRGRKVHDDSPLQGSLLSWDHRRWKERLGHPEENQVRHKDNNGGRMSKWQMSHLSFPLQSIALGDHWDARRSRRRGVTWGVWQRRQSHHRFSSWNIVLIDFRSSSPVFF